MKQSKKKTTRFTYSPQLNEYNNFESNSNIAKNSGNIMFCIFDVFHRLNNTPWIKNLSFSCLFISNEVCFLVPVKSYIMWSHELLNWNGTITHILASLDMICDFFQGPIKYVNTFEIFRVEHIYLKKLSFDAFSLDVSEEW